MAESTHLVSRTF